MRSDFSLTNNRCRKEEVEAARHLQEKRETTRTGKLVIAGGSVEFCDATPIGLVPSRLFDVLSIHQSHQNCHRRVTRRQVVRHFTRNGTDRCQNGSSNLLTPYREQPRSTRNCCRLPTASVLSTRYCKKKENQLRVVVPKKSSHLSR